MPYRLLADAVLLLHLSFVAFVMLGGLFVLRRPRLAWLHLPAVAWGAWIEFSGALCPLTPLENHLRALGAQTGYGGGFVEHYLLAALYPEGLTQEAQWTLGILALAVNAGFYLRLWQRLRNRPPGT
jgi:hypothetical protein